MEAQVGVEARGSKRVRAWILGGAAAGMAAIALLAACSSLPKDELARRLAALPKNAAMGEVERREIVADLGEGGETFELAYVHAPAVSPLEGALPVVLVHGTPSTLFAWTEVIHGEPGASVAGLAAERDVYAIEVIGHGIATGDGAPYGFERCARFVAVAIRGLGLERVFLVGSSYGGEFAWRAALNEPALVAGLVLLDSSGLERRDEDWLPEEIVMRENPLAKLGWMLNDRERIAGALEPHFDTVPPDRVEEFFLVCENATNWRAMIDLARDENGEREQELARLDVPTLLVWGERDLAYPLEHYGRRFASELPNAELVVAPDTGHYPHEERPAKTRVLMERFFARVEGR